MRGTSFSGTHLAERTAEPVVAGAPERPRNKTEKESPKAAPRQGETVAAAGSLDDGRGAKAVPPEGQPLAPRMTAFRSYAGTAALPGRGAEREFDIAAGAASGRQEGGPDTLGGGLRSTGDAAPAPSRTAEAAPLSPARTQAILEQVAAARQQLFPAGGRIKVTLDPEELGAVDLEVVVRRQRVEVIMVAERADVQQLLQSRGDEIRSALLRQDMRMESFQVLLQDNGEGGRQQSAWMAMDGQGRGGQRGMKDGEGEPQNLASQGMPISRSHRGLVSVFA